MNPDGQDGETSMGTAPASQADLRADIARTREQLGQTVQALVAKTDVKARASQQAGALASRVTSQTAGVRARVGAQPRAARIELTVTGVSVAVLAVTAVVIAKRRGA